MDRELVRSFAGQLQSAGAEVQRQIELGVYDTTPVKQANQELVDSLEAGLQVVGQSERARAQALAKLEGGLAPAVTGSI